MSSSHPITQQDWEMKYFTLNVMPRWMLWWNWNYYKDKNHCINSCKAPVLLCTLLSLVFFEIWFCCNLILQMQICNSEFLKDTLVQFRIFKWKFILVMEARTFVIRLNISFVWQMCQCSFIRQQMSIDSTVHLIYWYHNVYKLWFYIWEWGRCWMKVIMLSDFLD